MTNLRRRLEKKTKKYSRKNLYDFIQSSIIEDLSENAFSKKALNIGASGEIDKWARKVVAQIGARFFSIDIDPKRKANIVADVANLPFKDKEYSLVICSEILEHVWQPHQGIKEMHRVLNNGGTLILTTRFIFPLHDRPNDYFRYTKYGLERLFSNFSEVNISKQHEWLETFAVLLFRLIKERQNWVGRLVAPIYFAGFLIYSFSQFISKHLPSDYITSGYFIKAIK